MLCRYEVLIALIVILPVNACTLTVAPRRGPWFGSTERQSPVGATPSQDPSSDPPSHEFSEDTCDAACLEHGWCPLSTARCPDEVWHENSAGGFDRRPMSPLDELALRAWRWWRELP